MDTYEKNILKTTRILISTIQDEAAKTMKKIQDLGREFDRLILEKEANKMFYELLLEIEFTNDNQVYNSAKNIRKNITELFYFYEPENLSNNCNEAIFSGGPFSIQMCIQALQSSDSDSSGDEKPSGLPSIPAIQLKKNSGLSILYEKYSDLGIDVGDTQQFYKNQDYRITDNLATGVALIDLNTRKLSIVDFTLEIGPFWQICKIDKSTYFFQGPLPTGMDIINRNRRSIINRRSKGRFRCRRKDSEDSMDNPQMEAIGYLMNIKTSTNKIIRNGPNKILAASVFKNNKVYIFGGYNGQNLQTCESLNLDNSEWKSIHALPEGSMCMTAAALDRYIILSGYNLNCCYSYDDYAYARILNLNANCLKVVCKGWILTESVLYENVQGNHLQWLSYNILSPCNNSKILLNQTVFNKNHFFYFIVDLISLMRIDTQRKVVEWMKFS